MSPSSLVSPSLSRSRALLRLTAPAVLLLSLSLLGSGFGFGLELDFALRLEQAGAFRLRRGSTESEAPFALTTRLHQQLVAAAYVAATGGART